MAKTNTEKPSGKNEQKKKIVTQPKENKNALQTPMKKEEKKINEENKVENPKEEIQSEKPEVKKEDKKKTTPKIKKDFAIVNGKNVPTSTKDCIAICKFIKFKKIQNAVSDLEQVAKLKKAVPMKGEIPHRKGRIMSGRFPKKAAEEIIVLLKSLQGNANMHEIEEPIITEAIANLAARPFGRFGLKKKRSHVKIVAKNLEKMNKVKKKETPKEVKK